MHRVGDYNPSQQCPDHLRCGTLRKGHNQGGKGSKEILMQREVVGFEGERRRASSRFQKPALGAYSWTVPPGRRVDAETRIVRSKGGAAVWGPKAAHAPGNQKCGGQE